MSNVVVNSLFNNKIVVIKPADHDPVPLFCPLCEFPMKTIEDSASYRQKRVCSSCLNQWGYRPGMDTKEGFRKPEETQEELYQEFAEYLDNRKKLFMKFNTINFK